MGSLFGRDRGSFDKAREDEAKREQLEALNKALCMLSGDKVPDIDGKSSEIGAIIDLGKEAVESYIAEGVEKINAHGRELYGEDIDQLFAENRDRIEQAAREASRALFGHES